MTDTIDFDELAASLRSMQVELSPSDERIVLAIYRLLATGQPAGAVDIAAAAGQPEELVADRLGRWPGVFRDDNGCVVGFWGLAIPQMDHRLTIDDTTVHTWCAWDPLFIAPLLGRTGRVASTCPETGAPITLTVGPDGISDVSPPTAVISFLVPSDSWTEDVITSFCHYIWFFADRAAAERWTHRNPGTFVLSLEDAFLLGQRARLFGARS